jgi:hypothetical protein
MTCTSLLTADRRFVRPLWRVLSLAGLCCAVLAVICRTAAAAGTPPPSLPGPPPLAGSGLPARPAPGTVPVAGPTGPSVSLPTSVPGPGLLNGNVLIQGRKLTLKLACRSNGRVSLTASAVRAGVLARGGYACRQRQASVQLSLGRADARRLTALKSTIATVSFGSAGTQRYWITLETRSTPPPYWSDGGMECNLLGADEPYLVAPNFTLTPPAIIDVRPWVAWYTPANGWRWLGTTGLNSSSWYRWTATPSGVGEWITPTGALNPWTWAPIRVRPGQQTYALGVFEVIYWYHESRYIWAYTKSRLNASAIGTFCSYS